MIKLDRDKILFGIGILVALVASFPLEINLAVSLFLASLVVYIYLRKIPLRSHAILYLIFMFVLLVAGAYFIFYHKWPKYYIPFCVVPMLVTLLFSRLELSLLICLASSVTIASMGTDHLEDAVFFFTSAITASILVLYARRRMTIIRAGIITGLLQMVLLVLIDHFWIAPFPIYLILFLNGVMSGVIVLGVLPLFEYLFKTVTNISLLELADFNHPLLQRLIMEAPGTYHHSLIVGNLSESACKAVGANALLARIGAYYHDIGKLEKAEYFSENQDMPHSKHDELSPDMSKLIIMNHVKEGIELANKYNLSPALLDFISQHHGNSLVYYFYRRALESLEEDQSVQEEGFRYPGPKPNTKETAIVLLADSVEASTRALKDPSPSKIEDVVHKIINNKFIDGQLDECELTLKDLERISAEFIRILSGIYHSRISYPEQERSGNNHKKSAKEDPRRSEKDKKGDS